VPGVTNCYKFDRFIYEVERREKGARNPLKRDIRGSLNRGDLRGRKCDARPRNAGKGAKLGRKSKISGEIMGVFEWK
jgi:hypothetical protein